jgi:hypothetical protein
MLHSLLHTSQIPVTYRRIYESPVRLYAHSWYAEHDHKKCRDNSDNAEINENFHAADSILLK